MTFSIVIMVGRGYFLPTHMHEASLKNLGESYGAEILIDDATFSR